MARHNLIDLGYNLLSDSIRYLLIDIPNNTLRKIQLKMRFEVCHFVLEVFLNISFDTPFDILGESAEALLYIQIDRLLDVLDEILSLLEISLQLFLVLFASLKVLDLRVEVLDYILSILLIFELLFFDCHVHLV